MFFFVGNISRHILERQNNPNANVENDANENEPPAHEVASDDEGQRCDARQLICSWNYELGSSVESIPRFGRIYNSDNSGYLADEQSLV